MDLRTYDEARPSDAENGPREEGVRFAGQNTKSDITTKSANQCLTALLHVEGRHGLYGASFGGERLVHRSRDAELSLCRILADRGLAGALHVLDADTGAHRFTVADIELAAGCTIEESSNGPRLVGLRQSRRTPSSDHHDNQALLPHGTAKAPPHASCGINRKESGHE